MFVLNMAARQRVASSPRMIAACVCALLVSVTLTTPVMAGTIRLSVAEQAQFRRAFMADYSRQMAVGGYYDVLAHRHGPPPQLRMYDCLRYRCLIAMTVESDFDDALFLVSLGSPGTIDAMQPIAAYGTAIESAAFLPIRSGVVIAIASHTHMGTKATQVFAADGTDIGAQVAIVTYTNGKTSRQGSSALIRRAQAALPHRSPPFAF